MYICAKTKAAREKNNFGKSSPNRKLAQFKQVQNFLDISSPSILISIQTFSFRLLREVGVAYPWRQSLDNLVNISKKTKASGIRQPTLTKFWPAIELVDFKRTG